GVDAMELVAAPPAAAGAHCLARYIRTNSTADSPAALGGDLHALVRLAHERVAAALSDLRARHVVSRGRHAHGAQSLRVVDHVSADWPDDADGGSAAVHRLEVYLLRGVAAAGGAGAQGM